MPLAPRQSRRIALSTLTASLAATVALVLLAPAHALAGIEPPAWRPLTITDPTHLIPGSPSKEIQAVTVNASRGTFTLTGKLPSCGRNETSAPIPHDATAQEFEGALPACMNNGEVHVSGGPTERKPYDVEYVGPSAYSSSSVWEADESGLEGGTATVAIAQTAIPENEIMASGTDVGGSTDGGPITIEDTLPAGVTATRVTSYDTFLGSGRGEYDEADWHCSPRPEEERTIRCTFDKYRGRDGKETPIELITGDTLIMAIHVIVTGSPGLNEANELTVTGGGAKPSSAITSVQISDEPAPYGPAPDSLLAALSNSQAGGHPSLTTAFTLSTSTYGALPEEEKDVSIDLPPGLVGDASQLPTCTMRQVESQLTEAENCPAATMVGVATIYFKTRADQGAFEVDSPVYAIKPAPGEPAAFGLSAFLFPVRLDTSVTSEGDYGIRMTAASLSEEAETMSAWITIWGVPADHSGPPANANIRREFTDQQSFGGPEPIEPKIPLLTSPQQCGLPLPVTLETDSWEKPGQANMRDASTTIPPLEGCEELSLQPSFTMLPDTLEAGAPAGYTMNMVIPQNGEPNALATPAVQTVKVTLPAGAVISPSGASGLNVCSEAEFGLHSGGLAQCPRKAQVGEVEIKTPALAEPLRGQVFLAESLCEALCTPSDAEDGRLLRLFAQLSGGGEEGIVVKLEGRAQISQVNGQVTVVFEDLPQLPIGDLRLTLTGGQRALFANPRSCEAQTTTADVTPWSAPFTPDVTATAGVDIDKDCIVPEFEPSFSGSTLSNQAGSFSPFLLTVGRANSEEFIGSVQVRLPPGLLGMLSGVVACAEPQANAGTCGPESKIGEASVEVGPGTEPYVLADGEIFLTGPFGGAPYGIVIVVPARIGPYALSGTSGDGDLIIRGALGIDLETMALTLTINDLPMGVDGIPLQLRLVNIEIDRPEFIRNPTNCDAMAISASVLSVEGLSAHPGSSFQVTNCRSLGLKPTFAVATSSSSSRADGASLGVTVSSPADKLGNEANIEALKVQLPERLAVRAATLEHTCAEAQFAKDPAGCSAASVVGYVRVHTPVLRGMVAGPVIMVTHGGAKFPSIDVVLQSEGLILALRSSTHISKQGYTFVSFEHLPDAPFESIELQLPQGPHSALAPNGALCLRTVTRLKRVVTRTRDRIVKREVATKQHLPVTLTMPTTITGQNGRVLRESARVEVSGCPRHRTG